MPKNRFEKKYTDLDVIRVLEANPDGLMLAKIQSLMGCSEMTLRNILVPLVISGQVMKRNIGSSEKRPVNLYLIQGSG